MRHYGTTFFVDKDPIVAWVTIDKGDKWPVTLKIGRKKGQTEDIITLYITKERCLEFLESIKDLEALLKE